MGAETFVNYAEGTDANKAFSAAVDQAAYEYGHRGYTGTIAEKYSDGFTVVGKPMPREQADTTAWKMIDDEDPRIDDKWGPAGAIPVTADDGGPVIGWLFFGWASS